MKTVLALYLKQKLHFDEDYSTVIYHAFSGLCYTTPIFGAMLADQFFGKYRTIFWISLIYVLGHILKTFAAIPTLGLPPVEFSLLGLLLIAIGTGGIKPCVAAFGGINSNCQNKLDNYKRFSRFFTFLSMLDPLFQPSLHPFLGKIFNALEMILAMRWLLEYLPCSCWWQPSFWWLVTKLLDTLIKLLKDPF